MMKNNFNNYSLFYIFKEINHLKEIISKKEKSLKRDKEKLLKLKDDFSRKFISLLWENRGDSDETQFIWFKGLL